MNKHQIDNARVHFRAAKEAQKEREAGKGTKCNSDCTKTGGTSVQRSEASVKPPYCNTGGYDFGSKNISSVTKIDWLRATTTDLESFEKTISECEGKNGILGKMGAVIVWSEKGMHGYDKSAKIIYRKSKQDHDYILLGNMAMAEGGRNQGGLFELTGAGCKIFRMENKELWLELYSLFVEFEWRFSRVDIALDLRGQYCIDRGYTVPKFFSESVNNKMFQSDKLRNPNMKQTFSMAGDWSSLIVGGVTPDTYDALEHCQAGLTAYVGSRKGSADFFRMYEKGKELLGAEAEIDDIDRAWIRIEHEMTRKGTGREIPLDVMIRPDAYFALNRPNVRSLMNELRDSLTLEQLKQIDVENFQKEKGLSLAKKVHWARYSYGRLFKTLIEKGHEYEQIFEWLTRSDGLKEFIYDLKDAA